MDMVNKLGCEVHEFFERAKHLGYTEPGFNPAKEALLFKELRDKGFVVERPNWGIPAGILDFVDDLGKSDCPRKLYGELKHRTHPPTSAPTHEASARGARPVTMMRSAPTYA